LLDVAQFEEMANVKTTEAQNAAEDSKIMNF
jgi:hypothetical protein